MQKNCAKKLKIKQIRAWWKDTSKQRRKIRENEIERIRDGEMRKKIETKT